MKASTLGAIRRAAARTLTAALKPGDTPALDARLLVAAALKIAPERLPIEDDRPVDAAEAAAIDRLLARRVAGEPVARIIGEKEFWGQTLRLSLATLVPRPDTETVVEAVLAFVDRRGMRNRSLRLADIGTGSGAILLALLSELPNAVGVGVDIEHQALKTAQGNAENLGLSPRALFVQGNWSNCCAAADVLVSNPPYIESGVIETLPVEVREHDPRSALDGGLDGLTAYRAIIAECSRSVAPGGAAFFEIGYDQRTAVSRLAVDAGFQVDVQRDLAGHDRVIALMR